MKRMKIYQPDELSPLLYTGNMFIDQDYFNTWIQIGPEQAIRIDYCPTRLEVISLDNSE